MKHLLIILSFVILGCSGNSTQKEYAQCKTYKHIVVPSIDSVLTAANVNGTVLIYDGNQSYYSNNYEWAKQGFLPASTFKIPNSIIALELGTIENESSIIKWDGETTWNKNWNQDLTLQEAYKYSCLPCYQRLTRQAGYSIIKSEVNRIQYPGMNIDSINYDEFWVNSESKISPFEQIEFLEKLHTKELPLSDNTYEVMNKIMLWEAKENYLLYGKTGLTSSKPDAIGWFVGFVKTKKGTYYFATNLKPGQNQDIWKEFVPARIEVTKKAFKMLKII